MRSTISIPPLVLACLLGCPDSESNMDANALDGSVSNDATPMDGASNDAQVNDVGFDDASASDANSPDAETQDASNNVTGTVIDVHHLENGTMDVPRDVSTATIAAWVPMAGASRVIRGGGRADGTFEIRDVPFGPYVLRFGNVYMQTDARTADLGLDYLGRPDVVSSAPGTVLEVDFTNLIPGTRRFDLFAANNNVFTETVASSTIGATLFNVNFPWTGRGLLDASQGDQLFINELVNSPAAGGIYQWILRRSIAPTITMIDGQVTAVAADVIDAPQTTIPFVWALSAFDAMTPEFGPNTTVSFHFARFTATPAGNVVFGGTLADFASVLVTNDVDFGNITFGDPYPVQWDRICTMVFTLNTQVQLGAALPTTIQHTLYLFFALDALPNPAGPMLGPVLAPVIDGIDTTTSPVLSATVAHALSWSPPSLGAPTLVRIQAYALTDVGGQTMANLVDFRFYSAGSPAVIPAGILPPGSYVFVISDRIEPDLDPARPFRHGVPAFGAESITGVVTLQ